MSKTTDLNKAMDMLEATSRTFFIPISRLADGLREAVTSAYLCMRAIDEIEDHHGLPDDLKVYLLRSISHILHPTYQEDELKAILQPYKEVLPEVSFRLFEWIRLAPPKTLPNILRSTGEMADGMAGWVEKKFQVHTEEDLDEYTYYVAGLVGLLLSELWTWYDQTETDRQLAIAFGRGLQAVNIIRNRTEDLERGADFYPDGWNFDKMYAYAKRNLELADIYVKDIQTSTILQFCRIPLILAYGTLQAIAAGQAKLTRKDVNELVKQVTGE